MEYTQHRVARSMREITKQLKAIPGPRGVKAGKRFIRQQDGRVPEQSADQREPVAFSS